MREKAGGHSAGSDDWAVGMCDESLVAMARTGNHAAFIELFERHRTRLFRKVHRITNNIHDAEDALQESCMMAFVHLGRFRGDSAFSTWLTSIAVNTALMTLRRRRRMTMASLDDPVDCDRWGPMEVAEPSNGPEENLLEKEMKSQIDRAVRGLPKSLRAVVEARQSPDTTIREIAMIVGISTTAAKSRLSRARHMLRKAART